MENLANYIINEFVTWAIIGFVGWRLTKTIPKQETGQTIVTIILGVLAYYFVKNPVTVLEWGANIVAKIFGR